MVEVAPRSHDKFNYRPAVLVLLANGAVHVTMLAWLRDQCPRNADLIKVEEIAAMRSAALIIAGLDAALGIFIVCDLLFFSVLARRPLSGFYGTL